MNQITFEVPGYPPAKADGVSATDPRHPHVARVQLLLQTAHRAQKELLFTPVEEEWVGLDIMLFGTPVPAEGDAISYLSSVAEALEDQQDHGRAELLGDLGQVGLYRSVRQIIDVTYRQAEASKTSYAVTVRGLGFRYGRYKPQERA